MIGDKRFILQGTAAQQSPLKKMSLRRLELQNRIILPQRELETEKTNIIKGSERTLLDNFSLVPWHFGEENEF